MFPEKTNPSWGGCGNISAAHAFYYPKSGRGVNRRNTKGFKPDKWKNWGTPVTAWLISEQIFLYKEPCSLVFVKKCS
jgi:hypothetical protein